MAARSGELVMIPAHLLLVLLVLVEGGRAAARSTEPPRPTLRFGAIADCQYCDQPDRGARLYRRSPAKLEACVEHFNRLELDFVIHLGDFIDRDWSSFDVVCPIYERLRAERFHVLGNHDFEVDDAHKEAVPGRLGLPARHYEFERKGVRFVVLDGNDLSFHAYPAGSAPWRRSATYYKASGTTQPKWNGALGLDQLEFLDRSLAAAAEAEQRAIVFCHFPVFPADVHNLWNADAVRRVLESHTSFVAYLNGHNHAGNYGVHAGRHYLSLHGMVDTEQTSYAVVEVWEDRLEVRGFGRQPSRRLAFPESAR